MDYRIDESAQAMYTALIAFLGDRMPDPAAEPDKPTRAAAWRELVESEWLEQYASSVGDKDPEPADVVHGLHVAEAFGTVPVTGPVHVVAGYLHPLARIAGLDRLAESLRAGDPVAAMLPTIDTSAAPQWRQERLPVVRDGDELTVSGRLEAVTSAADASSLVIPVDLDGRPALASVGLGLPGVEVGPAAGVDVRRPVAPVSLSRVVLHPDAVHTPGDGSDLLDAEHRAGIALSLFLDAEAVGGSSAVLARSVEYCTGRVQFGRPIGSFQAVRHKLADAAVRTEGARSLVQRTGWDVASGAPGALVDVLASRLWCSGTYLAVCEAGVQVHGGMGFTWEQRVHLWHRAAIAGRGLSTDRAAARAGVAAHLRGTPAEPVGAGR
jgi:alkylation response protein AidB-like acyl-CoA dehydrogenase